jgi:hypothetical protein
MGAKGAEVPVVLRSASKRVEGCRTNISAVKINQGTLSITTFANVSSCAFLTGMQSLFTSLDTYLQVIAVFCRCHNDSFQLS